MDKAIVYEYNTYPSELLHEFTMMVVGQTGCGKTMWTKQLVENADKMIFPPPEEIIWCYTEEQKAYESLRDRVNFVEGLPDFQELKNSSETPKLLILDDFMDTMKNDEDLIKLFCRGSHHWNVSCIHICQAMCYGNVQSKARSNAHYLVIMSSPANLRQISIEAGNMYPKKSSYFMKAYDDAIAQKKYGYLFVDRKSATPNELRLRTNIFPSDSHTLVYAPP